MTAPDKFDWQRHVVSLALPPNVKLVALCLSLYADRDGTNARPGNARLMADAGLDRTTVLRHLGSLRDEHKLIERTFRARAGRPASGSAPVCDVYRLRLEVVALVRPHNGAEVVAMTPGSGRKKPPEVVALVRPHQSVDQSGTPTLRAREVADRLTALGATPREVTQIIERAHANPRVEKPYDWLLGWFGKGNGRDLLDQVRAVGDDRSQIGDAVETPWEGRPYD